MSFKMRTIKGKVHGVSDWDVNEPARAHVGPTGVMITLDDGRHVDIPWTGVKMGQNYLYDHEATLEGVASNGRSIRFSADGPELAQQLATHAPSRVGATVDQVHAVTHRARASQRVWLSIAVVLLVLGVTSLNWLPMLVASQVPVSWEERLGASSFQSVAPQGEVHDAVVTDGVQHVWDRLQPGLQPNPYHFQLHVVQSPEVNAFAMPGGTVVVYTALLKEVDSPEELAGVLAHESQHVIWRHSLKALIRSAEWDVVFSLLFHNSSEEMQKLGARMDGLAYSRSNESQADMEGARALMRAHIDPTRFPEFFRRLDATDHRRHIALLETHPSNGDRIDRLEMLIRTSPQQEYQPIDVDWKAVKDAVGKL